MDHGNPSIVCPSCGKQYAWKPEFEGRQLKCKCGATMSGSLPEQAGAACPECGAAMEDGAVLCMACGFNTQTGQRMGTEVDAAPKVPSAPSPAKKRGVTAVNPAAATGRPGKTLPYAGSRPPKPVDPHKQAEIKKLITIGIAFAVLAIVITLGIVALKTVGSGPASLGEDADARQLMNDNSMVPMQKWFETGPTGKMFGAYNVKQAQSYYDDWKAMGVKEVWISNAMMSLVVVFELPQDPAARKKIYDWQADWHIKQHLAPKTDAGGKYLVISIPIAHI